MPLFSLPPFPFLSTFAYLSSAYRRPSSSVISAVGGNKWLIFVSLCPLCYCCFSDVCNSQRGEYRLYSFSALGTWEPAIHEACKTEEGEVWYSETKEQNKKENVTQTDRRNKIGYWLLVSDRETGQRHYSNRHYTYFPIIHCCDCFGILCLLPFSSFSIISAHSDNK